MIGVETLITKINTLIAGGSLTELQIVQLSGAVDALESHGVSSVLTTSNLPNPVTNKGRFIFIEKESRYVFSDGIKWDINSIIDISGLRLYAWGINSNGQLGDNTLVNKSSLVYVVGGFTDWVQIASSNEHSLGVRANGTAWAWGGNLNGRLGDNTAINKSSPVSVVGGFTDWVQVNSFSGSSIGIRANGTAWAWGANNIGQLGDGTTVSKSSPVSVVGGFADWVSAGSGSQHSVGLRANGTLWAWGINTSAQLGDNTLVSKVSPVSVVGGFVDWIQLSVSNTHNLALRANGTAWAWGTSTTGALGDGTTVPRSSPVSIVGAFIDWIALTSAGNHSLGLRANGTAWAWGSNLNGQLGDGNLTTASKSSPVSVVGGFTDWAQLSAGLSHSLGLRSNGTAWAWGQGTFGQLGDESVVAKSSPVSVIGGFTNWVQLSAGGAHSLGLRG
jgi:alpha-tubulin suppressor-like RCC1 family protein